MADRTELRKVALRAAFAALLSDKVPGGGGEVLVGTDDIVTMRRDDGLSWGEIARITGLSRQAVSQRYNRWAARTAAWDD
jgi:hypothetical protein